MLGSLNCSAYVPAVFRRRTGPPSTTLPSLLTRMRSDALSRGHATPNGFTQKEVGSTGSYALVSTNFSARDTCPYSQSNMARHSFVKPEFGKNTESQCQSTFKILSLFVRIVERRRARELRHRHHCLCFGQAGFVCCCAGLIFLPSRHCSTGCRRRRHFFRLRGYSKMMQLK